MSVVVLAARLVVGALFVVAGALKLGDPTAFATEIANYRFFAELAPWLAVTLPPTEIVVGAALIVAPAKWRRAAALAAIGLLVMFTVAIVHVVRAGINVDCGCFGGNSGPVTAWTAARDLALLAAAALVLRFTKQSHVAK
ncbi:MAG TPA: MauE/DoxX family redox-associated membrane protein [Polyangia bacterium]|jgi:uncharacterized membrane protein YphA (DoxX/SURF4 family)